MTNTLNNLLHANSLVFNQKGFLILGQSGSGKSDLSLRLIHAGAVLISDDYTILNVVHTHNTRYIEASPPPNITGLLEVRGIGIIKTPYVQSHKIDYVIELVDDYPRMSDALEYEYETIRLKKIFLNPFEISVLDKIKVISEMNLL